ncbi:DAK2 domain-containing protein [Bacteroidota bacterium]
MKFINGVSLYYAFSSGNREVLKRKGYLNKINVFPVPDGDTGTNLAYTMNSIVEGSSIESSAAVVSGDMARAALLGSRGNSGIIFAQFMQGMHTGIKEKKELSLKDFVDSVKHGVESAYKSLGNPVEGTILTVMKSWADSLNSFQEKASDFSELMSHSIEEAKKTLQETPRKLKVLRDAGVVDAGGLGFIHFIEGFLDFIKSGIKHETVKVDSINLTKESSHSFNEYQKLKYRYCTEGVLKNPALTADELRHKISEFGDSAIAAGSKDYFKFHIHTNEPHELFYILKEQGEIAQSKVDDMQKQFEMQFHKKADIAIVVDSACDLPDEIVDKYQINIVPILMTFGNHHFLDKLNIKPYQFYNMLAESDTVPQTSAPTVKAFEHLYETLFEHYDAVISLHLSAELSGTFNAAKIASEKFKEKKISIINTKQISTSFGLVVENVAKAIEKGYSFNELTKYAEELSSSAKLLVAVPTLKYMIRSGRVSPLRGFIANLLNLLPIVSLDEKGASKLFGKSFSYEASIKKIIELMKKQNKVKPIENYAIGHANSEKVAQDLELQIEKVLGKKASFIYDIAPVIGAHAGTGAMSVSFYEK